MIGWAGGSCGAEIFGAAAAIGGGGAIGGACCAGGGWVGAAAALAADGLPLISILILPNPAGVGGSSASWIGIPPMKWSRLTDPPPTNPRPPSELSGVSRIGGAGRRTLGGGNGDPPEGGIKGSEATGTEISSDGAGGTAHSPVARSSPTSGASGIPG